MAEKSLKNVPFKGTKDHYLMWKFQMEAFLEELEVVDALYITNVGQAITAEERKMNRRAYMKLGLCLKEDDKVSFQLVKNATTTDFSQGSAKLAWEALAV